MTSVEVCDIRFSFGKKFQLGPINFSVAKGECLALLGENGSGKSTLLNLLTGELMPSSGQIKFNGKAAAYYSRNELAKEVAFVPQFEDPPEGFTLLQTVLVGRYPHTRTLWEDQQDHVVANQALEKVGLSAEANSELRSVSGGQRQRALIARALAQEPNLLLLDEPTAHIDAYSRAGLTRIIHELTKSGLTVILATHQLDFALDVADKVLTLKSGQELAQFSPSEANPDTLKDCFGLPYEKTTSPSGKVVWLPLD